MRGICGLRVSLYSIGMGWDRHVLASALIAEGRYYLEAAKEWTKVLWVEYRGKKRAIDLFVETWARRGRPWRIDISAWRLRAYSVYLDTITLQLCCHPLS